MDRYSYDAADRLLSVSGGILGSRTLGYDGLGDVHTYNINGYALTLDHDETGKPYHIGFNGTGDDSFGYSGLGQRGLAYTRDGAAHGYSFAGSGPGDAPLSDGRLVFTPGVGQRDTSTGQSRFSLVDALGGSRALLGSDGSPLDDLRYDAFGGTIYHGGGSPGPVPLGWGSSSGYQSDDSGLVLMGNRYYDPAIGRFLSPDPAGDGDNWYAYCGNDPVDEVDPTGLTPSGAPSGSSYGDPLGGQLFGIADYSSSIANGMGHWSHGKPTKYVFGQPSVKNSDGDGYGRTDWISDNFTFGAGILGTVRVYGDGVRSGFTGSKSPRLPFEIKPGNPQSRLVYDKLPNGGTRIYKARTYNRAGQRVRDFDFGGRGDDGPYPHAHDFIDNQTGGTQERDPIKTDINTGEPLVPEGEVKVDIPFEIFP